MPNIIERAKSFMLSTPGKVIMLAAFIAFIYQPIVDICLFFGIENSFVFMYSSWLIFVFILIIILRSDNGIIHKDIVSDLAPSVAPSVARSAVPTVSGPP